MSRGFCSMLQIPKMIAITRELFLSIIVMGFVGISWWNDPALAASDRDIPKGKDAQTAPAETENRTGTEWGPVRQWETEVMGVRVKGNAQRRDNEIRGVLHIYPPLSHKWTYHWTGKIEGDSVVASHTDGHTFRGSITPERVVIGVVTTKDGRKIPLRAPLP